MLVHATTKMEVFKAVILGGKDFAATQKDIDGEAPEKKIE
tara:strand:+ start:402 stop:521 length:120 start_codon:yes stop_codon:yes gene_type:complete